MTDYKELCASLREEAEAVKAVEWEIPICTSDHLIEAAKTIERLMKERDTHCYNCVHRKKDIYDMPCRICHFHDRWEWRGIRNE